MTTPPPRKRFQFHLSTAIVMMFVAGGLIWANVYAPAPNGGPKGSYIFDPPEKKVPEFVNGTTSRFEIAICYGWPDKCVVVKDAGIYDSQRAIPIQYERVTQWSGAVVTNGLASLTILLAVWFVLEWLIRRRAARKGA